MAQGCGNQALIEELATLNRKIRLTIKPVGGHEGRTNDGNQTCQRRYVPSMEIAAPSNGLKNILSLPQRAAFQERTKVFRPAGHTFVCKGKKETLSFFFLKGKVFHLSVNNFTVNGILQIDYIHNRLIPGSVLLFRKMQTPAQTLSISDESRFISSQTSSGSMESLTQLSSQICCSTVSMLRDFLLLLTSAANEPLSNLIIIFITFYF